jgi:hypothetical protein
MKSFVWFHRHALAVALLLGALASRASADTFDLFADDYGTLKINGQLIATVDTQPGGDTSSSVDLTPGWYSIAIDYKNRWGSTGLLLQDQPTADDPRATVLKSRLQSLDASGDLIEGLHADYYTLDGTLLGTVYGEGPIDHGYYNRYEGTSGSWANGLVDGNWGLFEERLTGQIYVGATSVPEPGTLGLLTTGLLGTFAYAWRRRRQAV